MSIYHILDDDCVRMSGGLSDDQSFRAVSMQAQSIDLLSSIVALAKEPALLPSFTPVCSDTKMNVILCVWNSVAIIPMSENYSCSNFVEYVHINTQYAYVGVVL